MTSILSIQSHVVYGYVGNKAAVYPLQYMGYDVWPINTVQFSNHTGYGKWQGKILEAEHIKDLFQGIIDIGQVHKCQAVLSGYMGSRAICDAVATIVASLKSINKEVIYLCDPVIGGSNCYVKPEVFEFFKEKIAADIVTPNHQEVELLTDIKITDIPSLKAAAHHLHDKGIRIVVITGLKLSLLNKPDTLYVFVSSQNREYLLPTREFNFSTPVNGTGDLFSSLYLGHYLKTKDIGLALQHATYHLNKVLENTYHIKERELQVLTKYDMVNAGLLTDLIVL